MCEGAYSPHKNLITHLEIISNYSTQTKMAPLSTVEVLQEDPLLPLSEPWFDRTRCIPAEMYPRLANDDDDVNSDSILSRGPLAPKAEKILRVTFATHPRKRVSFAPRAQVHEVPHLKDLSDEEFISIWWTKNDYALIKTMYKSTVKMMMKGQVFEKDDKDLCARGLESKTRKGAQQRHQQKVRACKAVLRAQDFQRREGISDPLYLAELYSEYSRCCYISAHAQALADQEDALR